MPAAAQGRALRGTFRAGWSALHGGYEPAPSSLVDRWLTLVETAARPLARAGVSADLVTAAGVAAAGAAVPLATPHSRMPFGAALAVAASGLADSVDGAVAVLADRTTAWGYVLDSLADRAGDALYLAAFRRLGASGRLIAAAAAALVALEYGRARAAAAGYDEIGLVTVGERPVRILVTAAGLGVAGAWPSRASRAAEVGTAATAILSAIGAGQFLRVAAPRLRAQAGPISSATARADIATSGSPPPG
jgi:CDP-diacylglycerol--glycerol-3-phosphate 3-phosphatidyltransferase